MRSHDIPGAHMSIQQPFTRILFAGAALLIAMLSYQCGAALAKQLFPQVGAEGATAYRLGLAAVMLLAWRRPWRSAGARGARLALCGYGLAIGGMNLMFYLSLRTIPLGIAVAIEFAGPLAVALLGSRRLSDVVWALLAAAGLALLLPLHDGVASLDPAGVAYALAAGLGWALYIVLGKRAGAAYGADTVTLGTAIGALLAVPIGVAHAGTALLSPALLPFAFGVALLSSALPFTLEMYALTRMPARSFSTLLSLEPVVAALAGWTFLGERQGVMQWLAIGLIVVAATGATLSLQRPALTELPAIRAAD